MSDFLEKLFHATPVKEFAALAKQAPEKYESPEKFLAEVAEYLPTRLYERYYGETAPHSLFGLTAALEAQLLLPPGERWKPFLQQSWFVSRETKRTPWDLDAVPARNEGSPEARWHRFESHAEAGNFSETFSWAKGFLQSDPERKFFRERSLSLAMDDTAYGGYKFLYLTQLWQLAELLNWNHAERILFPALHLIVTGPKDHSLSNLAKDAWRTNPLPSLLQNSGPVPERAYEEFERTTLFGSLERTFEALRTLAQAGASLEAVRDALLLASARAVSNARPGRWIWPMRAFHFGFLSRRWIERVEPHRKTYPLLLAAALVQQASAHSRESDTNRQLDEVARRLCPTDTFNVLRSVVSHSDPFAAATAVYAILGMADEKKEELFQALMRLAVKNDGHICYGHDLLFTSEAVDCYRRSLLPGKDHYMVSVGFFLGRVHKKYELFSHLQ